MKDIILQAVALLVSVGAFLLGKYVFPNVPKTVTAKLRELAAWADKFVVWAREFMKADSGHDKMEKVVEQLKAVAKEAGWDVTEDQLRAIAQTAYENMMAGAAAAEANQDADKAIYYKIGSRECAKGSTVIINTPGAVTGLDGVPGGIVPGQQQEAAQAAQEPPQDSAEAAGGTTTYQTAKTPQGGAETPQDGASE